MELSVRSQNSNDTFRISIAQESGLGQTSKQNYQGLLATKIQGYLSADCLISIVLFICNSINCHSQIKNVLPLNAVSVVLILYDFQSL